MRDVGDRIRDAGSELAAATRRAPDVEEILSWRAARRRPSASTASLRAGISRGVVITVAFAVFAAAGALVWKALTPSGSVAVANGVYRDPAGWSIHVPGSWHTLPFVVHSDTATYRGVEVSNIVLPTPQPVQDMPLQANGNVVGARGIGLIIATSTAPERGERPIPSRLSLDDLAQGSAPAGEPSISGGAFSARALHFVVTVKWGAQAYNDAGIRLVNAILRSFRLQHRPAQAPATPPPPTSPPSPPPNAVARGFSPSQIGFWDPSNGVILGRIYCHRVCPTPRGGLIATTSDGGKSWRVVDEHLPILGTLSVLPNGVAYTTTGSRLFETTTYGRTWWHVTSRSVRYPSFSSQSDGWAAIVNTRTPLGVWSLVRTFDGGRTWTEVPAPCPGHGPQVTSLSFPTPRLGWVLCTGEPGAGNQWTAVYRTSDGGRTWTKVYGGQFDYGYPDQVTFRADGHGWLLYDIRGQPLQTGDGGVHWTPNRVAQPEGSALVCVSFPNDADGYAVWWGAGAVIKLLRTSDGGSSWSTVTVLSRG